MNAIHSAILIVDHEVATRDDLARRLAAEGYMISTTSTAQQAFELLAIETYDLILVDEAIPDMNILDFLRSTRTRCRELPVFIMSSGQARSAVIKAISMGAADYIIKPCNFPVLKTRIWRHLTPRAKDQRPALSGIQQKTSATILVVDDNFANRRLLETRLSKAGHHAVSVSDGPTALEELEARNYDLVLLDLMMPGMDGIEVLRRIKDNRRLYEIPVIMVSASDASEHIEESLRLGAEDYITKPYNAALLQTRIDTALQGKWQRDREKGYTDHITPPKRDK